METTWRVEQVTERPGITEAVLQRVEWFKKNPDFEVAMADETQDMLPEEFIDLDAYEPGADSIDVGGRLTLDITDGPDLHPTDAVVITLRVQVPVEVE